MHIEKHLITKHYTPAMGRTISYIVLHDTANPTKGADALAHVRYFKSTTRSASAHYVIDETGIYELVEQANVSWHCGDGKGRYGITNQNSIGIELCIHEGNNMSRTYEHARTLIRELMAHYHLPKSHVVRHYDASRKLCPGHMAKDNWALWWGFWESL